MATVMVMATATTMRMTVAMAMVTEAIATTMTAAALTMVAEAAGSGRWYTMTTTMIAESIPLEELFADNSNTLDAFGDGGGDVARVAVPNYLARRLHTLILSHVCGNVTIEEMGVGRHPRHHGGGRERGGKDDAGGGGSGPTLPIILTRTDCHVLALLLGVGQMPTLEVLLRSSSVVALSSKSAALATAPFQRPRPIRRRVRRPGGAGEGGAKDMGGQLDTLCPPMRIGMPPILESSPSRASGPRGGRWDCHRWCWYQQATASGAWWEPITSYG